jgi:hypothetical protein
MFTKSFKESLKKWDQVTLPKSHLSPIGTNGLLGVKGTLDKLSFGWQDRNLLKYTNCGVSISLKRKKLFSWKEFEFSFNIMDKLLATSQTLDAKPHKKCYHVGFERALFFEPLAYSVKAPKDKLSLLTNQIVGFLLKMALVWSAHEWLLSHEQVQCK